MGESKILLFTSFFFLFFCLAINGRGSMPSSKSFFEERYFKIARDRERRLLLFDDTRVPGIQPMGCIATKVYVRLCTRASVCVSLRAYNAIFVAHSIRATSILEKYAHYKCSSICTHTHTHTRNAEYVAGIYSGHLYRQWWSVCGCVGLSVLSSSLSVFGVRGFARS